MKEEKSKVAVQIEYLNKLRKKLSFVKIPSSKDLEFSIITYDKILPIIQLEVFEKSWITAKKVIQILSPFYDTEGKEIRIVVNDQEFLDYARKIGELIETEEKKEVTIVKDFAET